MAPPIRVGVLSFAHYHATFWSEAFRDSPLAEFVGIWDDHAARGAEAARRYGVRFWPELEPLLEACDAVGITSETVHHARLAEAAAHRRCHILCEKPLATTLDDCDRIARAVAETGVVFMQSFPKRFDPVNHELERMVREGELGRLSLVRVRHGHFHGLEPPFTKEWYADPALGGGGALLDEGVHGADFLRWLFGEPESVTAMISSATLGLPVEDAGVALFRFPGGLLAELTTSWSFAAADNSVELYGTGGAAVLSGVDLGSRDITPAGFLRTFRLGQSERRWTVSPIVPRFKTGGFHQQNPVQFLEALSRGTPAPITLEDGRRAVELILAAYEAARTGRRQPLPPPGGRRESG
ncbi:MAG: Gfo/Idh/MocA family oxidoreductase [Candidatus Rokubacteria bacterium]|nr:Gfo/Idh/MocA family oxidoreductase [Candidatus Rokubacteria bacterium]